MPLPFSNNPFANPESSPSVSGNSQRTIQIYPDIHDFRHADGAMRSPCPALNALANHSYLPHDGRNVTFSGLLSSLQAGFGLSAGFALFMTVGTFILLRRPFLKPFNLHQCARHHFIEHNASMVHDDASLGEKYAPIEVNHSLLARFLARAHALETGEEIVTMENIAEGRIERETVCGPIHPFYAEIARGEFAMVMEIFGKGGDKNLVKQDLKGFLDENRLPVGWKPSRSLGLWDVVARTREIKKTMMKMRMM